MTKFNWRSRWIGRPDAVMGGVDSPVLPAPCFRKEFFLDGTTSSACLKICGLGYYECYLNGHNISDHRLAPRTSVYDRHVWYDEFDVSRYLVAGRNIVGVLLGNGFYNSSAVDVWQFHCASWRDYPKLLLELNLGGKTVLKSDSSWRVGDSPIIFDAIRNGEYYDARQETAWLDSGFDDSGWKQARIVPGPGGELRKDHAPPCRILETIPMRRLGVTECFDAGECLAGHVRILVAGPCGAKIKFRYAERSDSCGHADTANQKPFIKTGEYQTDCYILAGAGTPEEWEPRFVYHGFRYVEVESDPGVKLLKITACKVGTDFTRIGGFVSGNPIFDRLQLLTMRSYHANFVGIPTDCPHREKNGWTGDAMLASDTGLYNFDSAEAYAEWLTSMRDCQRPSGQFPGIVPSPGWGYNAGGGPVWDSAIFEIPYRLYCFTGEIRYVEENYPAIVRHMEFCASLEEDGLVDFGIGDWCHWDTRRCTSVAYSATASYISGLTVVSRFAALLGKRKEALAFEKKREKIRRAFNRKYYHGDGLYGDGKMTELGTALFFDLPEPEEREKVARLLARTVEDNHFRADFGILGAKYVPRVLSENGYIDHAFRLFTQEEYPGWGYWVKEGASALWEHWDGTHSRAHIMFGDLSAWFFRYVGGFRYDFNRPGFRELAVEPYFVRELHHYRVEHRGYVLSREGELMSLIVPAGCRANVRLPDGRAFSVPAGCAKWKLKSEKNK